MEATRDRLGHDEDLVAFGRWLSASEGRRALQVLAASNLPLIEMAERLYRIFSGR